jgi:uncharacterized protein (DUF2141 family)
MTRFQNLIAAIALTVPGIAAATTEAAPQAPASLELAFTGIETPQGMIMVAIFASEDTYNGKGAPAKVTGVPATAASVKTMVDGLPAGKYAAKIFHDIDGDGQMGVNPFGMTTEPFAFSNDAKGEMGPASWAAAAFDVKAGANTHTISIK